MNTTKCQKQTYEISHERSQCFVQHEHAHMFTSNVLVARQACKHTDLVIVIQFFSSYFSLSLVLFNASKTFFLLLLHIANRLMRHSNVKPNIIWFGSHSLHQISSLLISIHFFFYTTYVMIVHTLKTLGR